MNETEWILNHVFFPRDPSMPYSLYECLRRGMIPQKWIPEVMKLLDDYSYPRRPQSCKPATREDESPGWRDVVRAYEEDR